VSELINLDPRDKVMQAVSPTVMVPTYSKMEYLTQAGKRYLATQSGILMEMKNPWLHLVLPVACQEVVKMPYGNIDPWVKMVFKKPVDLLGRFENDSLKSLPAECAAWIIWDDREKKLVYRELEVVEASATRVRFHRPPLEEHQTLALDLHSHGVLGPFFSGTDDKDDYGEFKVSGVLGYVGTKEQEWLFRLCAGGLYLEMPESFG